MREKKNKPPVFAEKLFVLFTRYKKEYDYKEALREIYDINYKKKGRLVSGFWYWRQVLYAIPQFYINQFFWSMIMFKNYFKITIRNVLKYKTFSFINIFNLAIGIAGCILISLFVLHEYSYDGFHENADDIYRIEQDQIQASKTVPFHVTVTSHLMAPAIKEEIPDIKNAVRLASWGRFLVKYGENTFSEFGVRGVDPFFLEMFSFPFIEGAKTSALESPNSIVLSKDIADKYFGKESPLGKTLTLNKKIDVIVTGVFENVPSNSSLSFDMLVPYKLLEINNMVMKSWTNNLYTFVTLNENASIPDVNEKMSALRHRKYESEIKEKYPQYLERFQNSPRAEFMLKPLKGIHLNSHFGYDRSLNSNRYLIRLFSAISFIILLVACINFMNLSTARSTLRGKEIGMRKVVGAQRGNIIRQFFTESIIFSVFSLLTALILVQFFIPKFNTLAGRDLSLNFGTNLEFFALIVLITVLSGLAAGSYPALVLSSFKPVSILKNIKMSGSGALSLRKILVIFQFTVFSVFLASTITVYKQLVHLRTADTGIDKDRFAFIRLRGETKNMYPILKNELLQGTLILGVTGSINLPYSSYSDGTRSEWEGKGTDEKIVFGMNFIHHDFIKTLGLKIVSGEDYYIKYKGLNKKVVIINETAEKVMNVGSAVGKTIGSLDNKRTIIGVVKDYNFHSLTRQIWPQMLFLNDEPPDNAIIKFQPDEAPSALAFIESTWKKVVPDEPFEFGFFREDMESMYASQERMGDIFKYFSILIAVIASLGLFGLTLFSLERRTKEIGIRKVLGSSISGVIWLLIKDLVVWIVLACIISVPVSYYLMSKWLEDFAYRIDLSWDIFALGGIIALAVTSLTVLSQTIKASRANPTDSLRYE
ncbi:ABC transporter permease [candidate division KSB1 bacterium]